MNVWEVGILQCIRSLRGQALNEEIYERIGEFIELTDEHLRITRYQGRPAYVHQVRSHLSNPVEKGHLGKKGRGQYYITDKGKNRIGL